MEKIKMFIDSPLFSLVITVINVIIVILIIVLNEIARKRYKVINQLLDEDQKRLKRHMDLIKDYIKNNRFTID